MAHKWKQAQAAGGGKLPALPSFVKAAATSNGDSEDTTMREAGDE